MKRNSRHKRHRLLLEELQRYGWKVEACYVHGDAARWCVGSADERGRPSFRRVGDFSPPWVKTMRTPPFRHAEHSLMFVVVPAITGRDRGARLVRTWAGLQKFVDEARGEWILAEAKAGRLGETAKRLLGDGAK